MAVRMHWHPANLTTGGCTFLQHDDLRTCFCCDEGRTAHRKLIGGDNNWGRKGDQQLRRKLRTICHSL